MVGVDVLEDAGDNREVYFTIKAADELHNYSALGNVASGYLYEMTCGDVNESGSVAASDIIFLVIHPV